jgi:hypothetical protein
MSAHPLSLVAIARLSRGSNKSKSKSKELICLKLFSQLFPNAVDKWLSDEERLTLADKTDNYEQHKIENQVYSDPVARYSTQFSKKLLIVFS